MKTNVASLFPPPSKGTPVTPKVGDILVGSYGYEASYANFAKVLKVNAKTVVLGHMGSTSEYKANTSGMNWDAMPNLDGGTTGAKVKRFIANEKGYMVKNWGCCTLRKWDGEPVSCYDYH